MQENYHGHGDSIHVAIRLARLAVAAICVIALVGSASEALAGDTDGAKRICGDWDDFGDCAGELGRGEEVRR